MRNFDPEDIYLYHSITSLDVAPSRGIAACTVTSEDRDKDRRRSAIWCVPLQDGGARAAQMTSGTDHDSAARWSPDDAQLAFISDRGGTAQVFLRTEPTGDSIKITDFPGSVVAFEWSPSGKELLVTASVTVDAEARGGPEREGVTGDSQPQVAWRLPYKADGVGFILGREIHLFVLDVDSRATRRITHGPFDVMGAAWSADGASIIYSPTREGRFAHRTDLWTCDAGGANHRQITWSTAATQSPFCSPDGKWIAFAGAQEEGDARPSLWVCDRAGGDVRSLGGPDLEIVPSDPIVWTPDSQDVHVVAAHRGRQKIARVHVADGEVTWLVAGERHVSQVALAGERLVFVSDGPLIPAEVCSSDLRGADERCHTSFNAWWNLRDNGTATMRRFDVPDGKGGRETIEGWLLVPPQGGPPYPLVVDAHGGPASYALLKFESQAYVPMLLSRGFAVLALNTVGSSSYGREFCDRLRGRWGELDLPQQTAVIDTLRREGFTDDRLAMVGKSYGGYLAAWAMGTTDCFRAGVVIAPVGNLATHFGTSDSGYYVDEYSMKARPGEGDVYRRLSPIDKIGNVTAPTLFLQGKDDERCPVCQSEELFANIMRRTQTPTELVIYPGVGHMFTSVAQPSLRKDAFSRILEWIARWCTKAGETPQEQHEEEAPA
jgi:dipeptidyl aminopeptidase/acylaminoacyl peptidase